MFGWWRKKLGRGDRARRAIVQIALAALTLAAPAQAANGPLRVVALGDSLTAGYGLPGEAAFPAVLERLLRADGLSVEIANAGVSGDTATGGLERLDWSVPEKTDVVIVELGANDMLRGISPATTRKALEEIIQKLQARGAFVVLAGMRSMTNWGDAYRTEFEAIYADLAAKYRTPLYPFFLDGVADRKDLSLPDGLHPNVAGAATIAQRFSAFIKPIIEQRIDAARGRN